MRSRTCQLSNGTGWPAKSSRSGSLKALKKCLPGTLPAIDRSPFTPVGPDAPSPSGESPLRKDVMPSWRGLSTPKAEAAWPLPASDSSEADRCVPGGAACSTSPGTDCGAEGSGPIRKQPMPQISEKSNGLTGFTSDTPGFNPLRGRALATARRLQNLMLAATLQSGKEISIPSNRQEFGS